MKPIVVIDRIKAVCSIAQAVSHAASTALLPLVVALAIGVFTPAFAAQPVTPGPTQPGPQQPVQGVSSASATAVAAALAEAGFKAQEMVLTQLDPLIKGLALLLFVGAVVFAITQLVLEGEAEGILWLFLGPAMFFFMLWPRAYSSGADWQFGRTEWALDPMLQANISQQSQVAWSFAYFDGLVSDTIQQLITVVTNNNARPNLKFMVRQKLLDELAQAQIESPGLLATARYNLTHCNESMDAARLLALGKRDQNFKNTAEYNKAKADYFREFDADEKRLSFSGGKESLARDYLSTLLTTQLQAGLTDLQTAEGFGVYRQCLRDTDSRMRNERFTGAAAMLDSGFSCKELWCWMGLGVQSEIVDQQRDMSERLIPKEADQQMFKEIWEDIAIRFATPPTLTDADGRRMTGAIAVRPDLSIIPVVLTGHLLRKIMQTDPRQEMSARLTDRAGITLAPYKWDEDLSFKNGEKVAGRYMNHRMAEAKKYELYYFAMAMPYMQGAILYVLAMTFPFFALMLLVPGKAAAFFQWASLWVWAKSWDLGWALIMVVDDLLWSLMPHSSFHSVITGHNNDPVTIFESVFEGDPAYSLSQYYIIVSMMLMAVPMLTGEALLGSKKVLAGMLLSGIQSFSSGLGNALEDYVKTEQTLEQDQLRTAYAAKHAISNYRKGITDSPSTDVDAPSAPQMVKQLGDLAQSMNNAGFGMKVAGTALVAAGAVGIGYGVVAGSAAVGAMAAAGTVMAGLAGGGAAAGLAIAGGLAAIGVGRGGWNSGFSYTRKASELQDQRHWWNLRHHYWKYSETQGARTFDALRALNGRGEWWNNTNAGVSVFTELPSVLERANADYYAYMFRPAGQLGRAVLDYSTRFSRAVPSAGVSGVTGVR